MPVRSDLLKVTARGAFPRVISYCRWLFNTMCSADHSEPADNKEIISGQGGFFNYFWKEIRRVIE
jgi:hypothetical protein